MEDLVLWVTENLMGKVSNEVIIFLISMVPILELRGGLLAASPALLNVPILRAIPICIIGNFIPVPFILLFIKAIFNWMKKFEKLGKIAVWFENKAMNKKDRVEKYEFWGLVLFVGIPLPGTGAWTGSLIAALLNIDFKKAIAAVCVGIMLATVIMSCISYGLLGVLFG
ncbi:MAG: small multi-drug export protein [Lachnospiraceae bacterium]|nr:small multi-drug export protein [Lachnospiraceae bacterium]